ncbi:MAG: thioesterase family protein [Bacteroidota bacterium]|nr:thioesterase family protein [Bacteroidota bacterium]
MERIKINLPENFSFSTSISIRITDINYGGHVGNDSFLSLIHEARQQFLKHHGFTELEFAGAGLIMTDAAVEYKRELNYSDVVKISVAANDFDKLGFDIFYKLEVAVDGKYLLAGKAKTGMICFDYENKKKVSVPEEAIKKLNKG